MPIHICRCPVVRVKIVIRRLIARNLLRSLFILPTIAEADGWHSGELDFIYEAMGFRNVVFSLAVAIVKGTWKPWLGDLL